MLIDDLLREAAGRFSHKAACVCGERSATFGELDSDVDRFARLLVSLGVSPGDRVAVYLGNRIEAVVSVFGISRVGAVSVAINVATKPEKLCQLLDDCQAKVIILSQKHKPALDALGVEPAAISCVILCDYNGEMSRSPIPYFPFEAAPNSPEASRFLCPNEDDLAFLIYTSGSTGQPKGVMHTHRSLLSAVMFIDEYLGYTSDDVILSVLAFPFTYGLTQLLLATLKGAKLVLEASFAYPYEIVRRIDHVKATVFPGVPMMFATLLQMKDISPEQFDSVRCVTSASAALPPAHIERLRGLFRKARIFSMYGQTECIRASYLDPDELERRPESVGQGIPGQEVVVVDKDGRPVGPGNVGELVVCGPHVMTGYWNRPEETAAVLEPGREPGVRVLHTRDLFRIDKDGFLHFVSRTDDIIKTRGEKVSPQEVENVILGGPGVLSAAVVGVPDPILGEAIKAFVVLAEEATVTERDILARCHRRLESYMVPKYVEFRETLPLTATGKIRRMDLRRDSAQNSPPTYLPE